MKIVVAGCRDFSDYGHVEDVMAAYLEDEYLEIVHGGSEGADKCANTWAVCHGINPVEFLADWEKHGKAAGPIRNKAMAEYGDALVAFWDGESRGTKSMINEMQRLGKEVVIIPVNGWGG